MGQHQASARLGVCRDATENGCESLVGEFADDLQVEADHIWSHGGQQREGVRVDAHLGDGDRPSLVADVHNRPEEGREVGVDQCVAGDLENHRMRQGCLVVGKSGDGRWRRAEEQAPWSREARALRRADRIGAADRIEVDHSVGLGGCREKCLARLQRGAMRPPSVRSVGDDRHGVEVEDGLKTGVNEAAFENATELRARRITSCGVGSLGRIHGN
ncbi:hypothetical protein TZ00_04120 [Agreia bicolorata]|uniref:Uncharacterized protein n=1 Tax=Agreia bicolorata TaxID=110935 RepID=A0ABR5CGU9_9MICO|nr:hypothetical protein TZ00_04120 [Agreia bicolorata]